ncbi:MAG: PDZ domain-containing protein [Flavobacteriales bacterium]
MKLIITALLSVAISLSAFSQGNGYLGISMKKATTEGVRISDVLENGAAKVHDLRQNDIILSVNGVNVNTAVELKNQIKSKDWGEKISIVYTRNGHSLTKEVTLGNRADKVTYHVKRAILGGNKFEWNFDKTTIIRMESGVAKWIKKTDEAGKTSTHILEEGKDVPQKFSDLDDKLEIIDAINERNKGKKRFPFVTVYIKTYPAPSKNVITPKPELNLELKAFPNPSLGEFKFTFKSDDATKNVSWQVIDISGKIISDGNIADFEGTTTKDLNLTAQAAGVYLLRVVHNKSIVTERLVIK